jgi:hypothetical protein
MNSDTKTQILEAAISAMREGDEDCASKLLRCLDLVSSAPQLAPADPTPKQLQIEVTHLDRSRSEPIKKSRTKARSVYAWASIIETQYLRYLANKKQTVFSSPELYNWIECTGIVLSEHDQQPYGEKESEKRPRWRHLVGKALLKLRERDLIYITKDWSCVYSTVPLLRDEPR